MVVNGKGGQSEAIIGKWMKSRSNRQNIVLATKVGSETKEHGFDISKKTYSKVCGRIFTKIADRSY
ncbi:aldo/keto reductase [Chryseobacterium carnipullorum]|uniref:aldo/keto reductase n=1 Tax=Chryseobacterium carnipullorum TaxID=1124835 RepID=UPI0021D022C9|nr:aldo/keto reductase [Chryseobacterium carnipullorum]